MLKSINSFSVNRKHCDCQYVWINMASTGADQKSEGFIWSLTLTLENSVTEITPKNVQVSQHALRSYLSKMSFTFVAELLMIAEAF